MLVRRILGRTIWPTRIARAGTGSRRDRGCGIDLQSRRSHRRLWHLPPKRLRDKTTRLQRALVAHGHRPGTRRLSAPTSPGALPRPAPATQTSSSLHSIFPTRLFSRTISRSVCWIRRCSSCPLRQRTRVGGRSPRQERSVRPVHPILVPPGSRTPRLRRAVATRLVRHTVSGWTGSAGRTRARRAARRGTRCPLPGHHHPLRLVSLGPARQHPLLPPPQRPRRWLPIREPASPLRLHLRPRPPASLAPNLPRIRAMYLRPLRTRTRTTMTRVRSRSPRRIRSSSPGKPIGAQGSIRSMSASSGTWSGAGWRRRTKPKRLRQGIGAQVPKTAIAIRLSERSPA